MSKVTKNERISTLEDAVAMNWSDMKKIETKISRAMTDMAIRISNISLQLEGQQRQIHLAADSIGLNKQAIIMLKNKAETKPQLKQLDQSIFDGLDEKWRFAAVDSDGDIHVYDGNPTLGDYEWVTRVGVKFLFIAHDYDASNWQNSLIERDTEKELLEVDLSSELTGSELCRAMLARGDKYVMCRTIGGVDVISGTYEDGCFVSLSGEYEAVAPINNQGEPLTAAEAGF